MALIEEQSKKIHKEFNNAWNHGIIGKIGVIVIVILLWPLFLFTVLRYLNFRFEKNQTKRVWAIVGFLFLTAPISAGWLGATAGILTDGRVGWGSASNKQITPTPTPSGGNCIGPDGKRIHLSIQACEEFNNAWKNPPQHQEQQTQQPTSAPQQQPTAVPNQSYDKNLGNNYIAAKNAQNIFDTVNKAAPGAFTSIMLEASPEDPSGKSEEEYKKSVSTVFLQLQTTSAFWNSLDDSSRKDLVASFVTSAGNIFPRAYPHVYISNGARTVAEGEYNLTRTEPKITLK